MVVVLQISQNTSLKSWPHPSDSAYIDLIFTCKYSLIWKKNRNFRYMFSSITTTYRNIAFVPDTEILILRVNLN